MRILSIEDNPGDARLIREMLKEIKMGTVELECEETLASGLERLGKEQFDVLLLDLYFPDSQRLETLQKVRPFEQKLPVVVLTGFEDEETAQKALESGAQDYLVKGKITADSLERAIGYALGRHSAAEALRVSEEHYRLLVGNASEVILTTDLDLIVTYASPSVERQTGFTSEEVTGHDSREFITSESFDAIAGVLADQLAMQGETDVTPPVPVMIEVEQYRKDGSTYPVDISAGFLRDHDGTPYGILIVSRDITEKRKAEEALRETREYLESLLDHANAPIIVWDSEFKVQRFNHAFERLTGYAADEVTNREPNILFPVETREESLGKIEHTLSGEYWESVEIPILRKDGNIRVVLWNSANIYDEDGKTIIATIAQGQDITERKRAEGEITRLGHRLMEESDRVRVTIAADLHDDVGQSLNAIKIAFDMQLKKMAGYADDKTGERMAAIRGMLAETIDKVRNISVELVPVNLADLGLDSALQSYLEEFARETGVTCKFKTEGAHVEAGVEAKRELFRIAHEALTNVREHSKASSVEISTSWSDSLVSLSVRDDGVGFDVEMAYEESRAGEHFGLLGMRERARMLKGEFTVESEPGNGTTVTVSVPLKSG